MEMIALIKQAFVNMIGSQQTAGTVRHIKNKIALCLTPIAYKSTASSRFLQYGDTVDINAIGIQSRDIHFAKRIIADAAKSTEPKPNFAT